MVSLALPLPVEEAQVVAEFVGAEVGPHADPGALVARLEPGAAASEVQALIASLREQTTEDTATPTGGRLLFANWVGILDTGDTALTITTDDVALAALPLLDVQIRDALIAWLTPGTLGVDQFNDDVQALLSSLPNGWAGHECGSAVV